jgi:hypothetical protein
MSRRSYSVSSLLTVSKVTGQCELLGQGPLARIGVVQLQQASSVLRKTTKTKTFLPVNFDTSPTCSGWV